MSFMFHDCIDCIGDKVEFEIYVLFDADLRQLKYFKKNAIFQRNDGIEALPVRCHLCA